MNRPIHFKILTKNPDKVLPFYEAVLGWKPATWDGPQTYWLMSTGSDEVPGAGTHAYCADPDGKADRPFDIQFFIEEQSFCQCQTASGALGMFHCQPSHSSNTGSPNPFVFIYQPGVYCWQPLIGIFTYDRLQGSHRQLVGVFPGNAGAAHFLSWFSTTMRIWEVRCTFFILQSIHRGIA